MSDYIAEIQAVFLKLHNCDAEYVETVPVVEQFQGETVFQGDVEVFDLTGHPKAARGYGWGYITARAEGDVTSRSWNCLPSIHRKRQ